MIMTCRTGKYAAFIIAAVMCVMSGAAAHCEETPEREYAESYVLMEVSTGTVIRQRDGDRRVKMGSFNKLMTVLLAAEAMDRGELALDTVLTVSEHANSMQGAQIWLMPGEKMTLEDLLKGVIIGNANDAACVIAEKIGGTEEKFAVLMNVRAAELHMTNTRFTNCNGYYDDENQYTTAFDAALLLRELSLHRELTEIFTTRLDELKDGEVQLVTTNTLSHRYKGSLGFKCGAGPSSGYFAAEGAERDGMSCVAAVMDCKDEDTALALAREILDIGFEGYTVTYPEISDELPMTVKVKEGCASEVRLAVNPIGSAVLPKGSENSIEERIYLPDYVYAPLVKGDKVGEMKLYLGDRLLKTCDITAAENVEERNFRNVLSDFMKFIVSF